MTAITLHLPDDLAARLAELPEDTRNEFATSALASVFAHYVANTSNLLDLGTKPGRISPDDELTRGEARQIAEGVAVSLAAEAQGRFRPAAEAFADMDARLGITGNSNDDEPAAPRP